MSLHMLLGQAITWEPSPKIRKVIVLTLKLSSQQGKNRRKTQAVMSSSLTLTKL